MEKLKNTRVLSVVGLICLFLGVVLPYFKFSFLGYTQDIKLWGYWEGKVMMALIIANILFIFKDYIEQYVPQLFQSNLGRKIQNANEKCAIIPTIGVAVFAIWLYVRLDIDTTYLKHGFGFWSLWIGVICLVVHTFLYKKDQVINQTNENQQSSYNPMQPNGNMMNQGQYINQSVNSNVKYCSSCGNACDSMASQCLKCGKPF